MTLPWNPGFLFVACQCGAEAALKREIDSQGRGLRPSFSRPGFVTFKFDQPCQAPENFQLRSTFARTWGFSLGKIQGEEGAQLARETWKLPALAEHLADWNFAALHVWERDRVVPGEDGFEPGPTPLAAEVDAALRAIAPLERLRKTEFANQAAPPTQAWVLDVVLVEPGEWWIGCHRNNRRTAAWVGGIPPLRVPEEIVSRAYLKMAEALEWSALPIARDEVVVELGCSPGGAAQALLGRGLIVIGIDPADVDPSVLEHPNFLHLRRRSTEVPKKEVTQAHWLAADMNVAPQYTLDAVEDLVVNKTSSIRGMILTLKIADWSLADQIGVYVERIRGWGYHDIRTRQLAFNRQEICLVALRSRAQRRVKRGGGKRRVRRDRPHADTPRKPHFDGS